MSARIDTASSPSLRSLLFLLLAWVWSGVGAAAAAAAASSSPGVHWREKLYK